MKAKPKVKAKPKTVRKSKKWTPHAKQVKMSELLLNPEDRRSKQDKCNEVGITTKTLWEWMKNENYIAYINAKLDQFTNSELAEVWRALINQCKRGNVQAMKLFFEMKWLHPDIVMKRTSSEYDQQRIQIENKKLALLEAKSGNSDDAILKSNERVMTIAELLNNPVENRKIEDFEEDEES